jgi:hypothetical protein
VAPEPAKIPNEIDPADDTGDFPESSDLCDFGYALVRRETNPDGNSQNT